MEIQSLFTARVRNVFFGFILLPIGMAVMSSAVLAQKNSDSVNKFVYATDIKGVPELQVKAVNNRRPVRVIARLSTGAIQGELNSFALAPAALSSSKTSIKNAHDKLKKRLNGKGIAKVESIDGLPLAVVEVNADQLEELIATGEVAEVFEDIPVPATLATSIPLIGANNVHAQGTRGAGQTIAILDSGVQANHPFLNGRVVEEACYSSNSTADNATTVCPGGVTQSTVAGAGAPCTVNGCNHGTHVAGIAAGRANGVSFNGVAPDANIFAIQVFSRFVDGNGRTQCAASGLSSPCILTYTSDQIRALTRVRDRRAALNISAANMSLGGGQFTASCPSDTRAAIINELRTLGVATVIAAGNSGYRNAVGAPGCIPNAITVGSTTSTDAVSAFSNISNVVDLLAPGSSINSSLTGSTYGIFSGTSMAAPHVAGAFALLRSRVPAATVDQTLAALRDTGTLIAVPGTSPALSIPRINLSAAVPRLVSTAGPGVKIAEFNDPATGNTPGCSFNIIHSAGSGNVLYYKYRVVCPAHTLDVERVKTDNSCQFNTLDARYYVQASNCDNWRIYFRG